MSRALEKAIRRSEVVDRESLCIIAGQKVNVDFTTAGHMLNRCFILGLAITVRRALRKR